MDMGAEAEEAGEVASCPLARTRSSTARRWYGRRKGGIARPEAATRPDGSGGGGGGLVVPAGIQTQ
jgi:hypothetical protein